LNLKLGGFIQYFRFFIIYRRTGLILIPIPHTLGAPQEQCLFQFNFKPNPQQKFNPNSDSGNFYAISKPGIKESKFSRKKSAF
jgi:hypothetical protein